MRAAVAVAAFMAAVPVMAQLDTVCYGFCVALVNSCCNNHNDNDCTVLSDCGANYHTDACSNWDSACIDYCSDFFIKQCI